MTIPGVYRSVGEAISTTSIAGTQGSSTHALTCSTSKCPATLPLYDLRVVILMVIACLLPIQQPVEVMGVAQEVSVSTLRPRPNERLLISEEIGKSCNSTMPAEEITPRSS